MISEPKKNSVREPFRLKLSPNVRLRMTMQREMQLDTDAAVFTDSLYEKYLSMHRSAILRQDGNLKAVVLADIGLAMLLFGKNVTIPGTSLGLHDIPAGIQVLTALSSFAFLMLSLTFLNSQLYQAVIEQFSIRTAAPRQIDPDFLTAADTFTELYIKAFRGKMNIFGIDFYEAGRGFRAYYGGLIIILVAAFISILLLHLAVIGYGVWLSLNWSWLSALFVSSVFLTNLAAVGVNLATEFSFTITEEQLELPLDQR
ncbi:hypothetical protein ASD00_18260 [Ensifer sp. Root31]|uniref:hypothetical protein n=1 Tax=Ensifer sp. Root31 TaxID=1736512 RepID=UPI00070DFA49|nr:hypothetical protein [Ensifer sp. Root31]KQU96794.1 hypothetical protein ASD00_18260 [Ensifer sp. Root31]